jgi:hypothetical protein
MENVRIRIRDPRQNIPDPQHWCKCFSSEYAVPVQRYKDVGSVLKSKNVFLLML